MAASAQTLLVLGVVAVALFAISGPLLSNRRASALASDDVRALEVARDAKLLEIRDAEMDLRTGKLSEEDYAAIDTALRAEAVQILEGLDDAVARQRRLRVAEAAGEEPEQLNRDGATDERLPSAP